jgi:mannose-6-phosphate isomerase-like protein (cupin superfamily)
MGEPSLRPWGSYTVLHEDDASHKVKVIEVAAGQRLSLQSHNLRAEHWFVVRGEGVVTLDDLQVLVRPGSSIDIPTGTRHRVENTGDTELVFVEVQHGSYFGEDDIVRYEDDYGRAEAPKVVSSR